MSPTPIAARRGASDVPRVRVTAPEKARQVRIAFNPALVERFELAKATHLFLEHDEEKQTLRFIPSEAIRDGVDAHKLLQDGGVKEGESPRTSRILLPSKAALSFLPTRSYDVKALRNGGFSLFYGREES
jgi:hypothetical protein